ncbi:MAG: MerR family transcriptional regulator [Clostridium sp.]
MALIREYALYKGEELLSFGTISEIAEEMGVKKDTIRYYKTPAYKRKLVNRKSRGKQRILIEIEDDELE